MKTYRNLVLVAIAAIPAARASPAPEYCRVLRAFVESVQPDETREFTFRTSWGSDFNDSQEPRDFVFGAKRCEHGSDEPAEKVCAYLMEHGSIELTQVDVKDAVSCLSQKTKFDPRLSLNEADFHFSYGSENRGALIDITFKADSVVGGTVFRLVAEGY